MKKIGLVFDSTVYLPKKVLEDNNVKIASLNIVDGLETTPEVDVTVQWVLDKQDKNAGLKTSQPSPGEFLNSYESLFEEGYEKIFVVTLSKNISGTYQSATLAQSMLDQPDKVYIFDTHLCAYGTEMIAQELIDLVNNDVEFDIIKERVNEYISTSVQMFTVENLFSLAKGGRLTATQAMLGTVLRIKPIIKVIDGKLVLDRKERSYKKVHNYIINTIKQSMEGKSKLTIYLTETHSLENGDSFRDVLMEHFPNAKLTYTHYLGPVFSIHVGKKGYGVSWFTM